MEKEVAVYVLALHRAVKGARALGVEETEKVDYLVLPARAL